MLSIINEQEVDQWQAIQTLLRDGAVIVFSYNGRRFVIAELLRKRALGGELQKEFSVNNKKKELTNT